MLGFSPFKKHANKFNYIPRYYDPEEERRAQRRAELLGESPEHAKHEYVPGQYVPGQYVRTARTARAARREAERSTRSKRRFGVLLTGIVVLLLFFVVIYPKLTSMMRRGVAPAVPAAVESRAAASDLVQSGISDVEWQQMPITVVPNDYEER